MNTTTIITAAAVAAAAYLATVRHLRFARVEAFAKSHGYAGLSRDELYERVTLRDAEEVIKYLARYEFPKIYKVALQFALFRTYAIPSISTVLKKTGQLAERKFAGRRYVDTTVLIAEMTSHPLDSERASLAIARMNYLHSLHPDILPRDTLYTLLLFATQPPDFIERLEWRTPTNLERVAAWKFWSEVGIRMKIPPETIPRTFEDMVAAQQAYEKEHMAPCDTNNYVGQRTVELLLYWVPTQPGKLFAWQVVLSLLDQRLREGMKFGSPQPWAPVLVNSLVSVRRFVLRYLCLPRSNPVLTVNEKPDPSTGRYYLRHADNEPWYVQPTWGNTWGVWGWVARIMGKPVAGQKGFGETGYQIESVGPVRFEKTGVEKVRMEAMEIRKVGAGGGCPFA
ncbi:hypothetical protein BDD12DRAFT_815674 [Trichophaea hybrida]|nr:hypothetical protein BDD12DRAFT_815674 [Trichophaea hybrida]